MIDPVDADLLNPWESMQSIRRTAPVVHSITKLRGDEQHRQRFAGPGSLASHGPRRGGDGRDGRTLSRFGAQHRNPEPALDPFHVCGSRARKKRGIPIVIDPVGAGATTYRTSTARELIKAARPCIIRGNASEIMAVCRDGVRSKGVDSQDPVSAALSPRRAFISPWIRGLHQRGNRLYRGDAGLVKVRNGHPMMTRVTGLGCTASALCGAFAAVEPDPMRAAAKAMIVMGVAGEMAAEGASGPARSGPLSGRPLLSHSPGPARTHALGA